MTAELSDLVKRLEAVTCRLEKCGTRGPKTPAADNDDDFDTVDSVTEYENVVAKMNELLKIAANLPSEVHDITKLMMECVQALRQFIRVAVRAKAPTPADLPVVIKPLQDAIMAVTDFRNHKSRPREHFNHLSTISESIPAFGWVCVAPRPLDYMNEMSGAGDFYSNRVLKDFKETPGHKEWTIAVRAMYSALKTYVTANHKAGVTWNGNGAPATEVAAKIYGGKAGPAAPPPPPTACPPPPPPAPACVAAPAAASTTDALFAALNKGADITSGLKKVPRDQMVHKNPELRGTSVVREADLNKNKKAAVAPKAAQAVQRPAKLALEKGTKWNCEFQKNAQDIVIEATMKHSVYIYKCEGSVITIKGKFNSVTIDGCKKCGIVVDTLLSSIDIINSQSTKIQINDRAPIVNIDKSDGAQVFVKRATGLSTEFITAKSSEVNVCLVEDNGEYSESFIAEQFITKFKDGKFVTELYEVVG